MILSYNSTHLFVNYIKELLHSFNIPGCKIFDSQEETIQYFEPIKEDFETCLIIKKFKNDRDSVVLFKKEMGECSFTWLSYYSYNEKIINLTKIFPLYNNVYDSYTHKWLGEYLRYLRDYKDLNLMSLYNCYTNEVDELRGYKYISIPVKYGKTYMLGLISKKSFDYLITTDDINSIFSHLSTYDFTTLKSLSKDNFTLINIPIATTSKEYFNESNLKLILRLPVTNTSSIVCLEGDYTFSPLHYVPLQANFENATFKINGEEKIDYSRYKFEKNYAEMAKENKFISNISLLKNIDESSGTSIPISDRLIEYLLSNVIIPEDEVGENILNAKFNLYSKYFDFKHTYNLTDKNLSDKLNLTFPTTLRFKLLETTEKNELVNINKEDLLGYVDKDIELILDDYRYPKQEEVKE